MSAHCFLRFARNSVLAASVVCVSSSDSFELATVSFAFASSSLFVKILPSAAFSSAVFDSLRPS